MGKHCGYNWLPKPGGGVSREKGGDISRVKTETRGQRQEITEQKRRLKPKRQHLRKERKKKRKKKGGERGKKGSSGARQHKVARGHGDNWLLHGNHPH